MFTETKVPEHELIVSRTDLNGIITYVNSVFAEISGYQEDELVGKPHNIIRHPDMPKSVFKHLWNSIKRKQNWSGYVKNLRKDGGYYWVFAEISGVYKNGKLVEYKSMRSPVKDEMKVYMQKEYDELREREEGMVKIVANITVENKQKLLKYAHDKNINVDRILDNILDDYLL
ncbi:MAG: PAS domain-containing protein [Sulfurospirillaceae bacterium]|nr:PAS domain-containing protein [Sulfurospirillaceae bacterium]